MPASNDMGQKEIAEDHNSNDTNNTNARETAREVASRKERRKAAKKEKRKQKRKEMAEMARRDDEARLNDPEEQMRLRAEEEQEKARLEKELREFEERERKILEEWEIKRADDEREEEERRRRAQDDEHKLIQNQVGHADEMDEDGWEYIEEGPPEIIWQGNEIIVKKKKIRVKKKDADQQTTKEDPIRPTSNPLPPQSEFIVDYKNTPVLSAQQLLENVAQETPNFGTEQDKAHCPFHLKTGACRFGSRCSRIHFYPDKSCTLLIKNMYNGPGLAWEQDEGLEHTDEEVKHAYEEFYEDVHTEFLKFGEIVNFKVSRNGSSHLRGNMYVHYKSLDSAVLAYQSVNGRYFAGKQLQCEFIGVTKWKVAICGEFMKSRFQACSRGTACNFIHCFRNPGGDYEWADWDKPAPRNWLKKMDALFGYSDKSRCERQIDRTSNDDFDRYHHYRSKEIDYSKSSRHNSEDGSRQRHDTSGGRKQHPAYSEFGSDESMYHSSREEDRHNRHSSRSRRHREKSYEILDEDIPKDRQHSKGSTSPVEEDKISHRQRNRKRSKRSSSRDDSRSSRNYDRSYSRSCNSSSRSRKYRSEKSEMETKRKRDTEKRGVSESRKVKVSRASDDGGRWEPDGSE